MNQCPITAEKITTVNELVNSLLKLFCDELQSEIRTGLAGTRVFDWYDVGVTFTTEGEKVGESQITIPVNGSIVVTNKGDFKW